MDTAQVMDQIKVFIRLCIKYRFWISLGVAALFAIIAYAVGAGPVQAKADQQTAAITKAANDVKQFSAPGVPNDQYKPIVDEKTGVMGKDVNTAWKTLYDRQAPLLTWPGPVQKRFREWGRKWPENVAENAVELAKVDYIEAYPKYVDEVYQTCHPFDYETGTGIVATPPKEVLLRPLVFEPTKLPELGTIWAGQERLWIQRTMLEVVAEVNKKAKDWDSAIIKQINLLEVGSPVAQDQRSIAKGEQLAESEAIKAPGAEAAEEAQAAAPAAGGMESMRGRFGGGGGPGGAAAASETIYFVTPEKDKGQYKILPVMMSVLIDQDNVQDLLVALENSPMSIQVMDFELSRPAARVTKPEKGTSASVSGYAESMMGGMMKYRMGNMGMAGYGGSYGSMMSQMAGQMRGPSGAGMMGGMMGGAAAAPEKKGVDKRSTNRGVQRKEETKAAESAKGPSLFDPYFDIVEVKIYGQGRFYNPPPADAEYESLGDAAAKEAGEQGAAKDESSAASDAAKTAPAAANPPAAAEPAKDAAKPDEPAKDATQTSPPAKAPAEAGEPKSPAENKEPAKAAPAPPEPAKQSQPQPAVPKS